MVVKGTSRGFLISIMETGMRVYFLRANSMDKVLSSIPRETDMRVTGKMINGKAWASFICPLVINTKGNGRMISAQDRVLSLIVMVKYIWERG
jgi:hypothetical protein